MNEMELIRKLDLREAQVEVLQSTALLEGVAIVILVVMLALTGAGVI